MLNDVCYVNVGKLKLQHWHPNELSSIELNEAVESALETLSLQDFSGFVAQLCELLVSFDWRAASAPDLKEDLRREKLVFRGSGGYKELRIQLLEHLAKYGKGEIENAARRLLEQT